MNGAKGDRLPVIVIGGGGHAKVLISTLLSQQSEVLGFVDVRLPLQSILGIPHLGDDSEVLRYAPAQVRLINGVGSVGSSDARRAVYERFRKAGYHFNSVVHPSAIIAPDVELSDGVQVMAGSIIQPGTAVGANVIINTGARIDHDCSIESHAHIAPGAILSGHVHVGTASHIGTGACVIQNVKIGRGAIVGAGAVVIRNVPADSTVIGVPASPVAASISSACK